MKFSEITKMLGKGNIFRLLLVSGTWICVSLVAAADGQVGSSTTTTQAAWPWTWPDNLQRFDPDLVNADSADQLLPCATAGATLSTMQEVPDTSSTSHSTPNPAAHCPAAAEDGTPVLSEMPLPGSSLLETLARIYAPVLFFHPLERYTLQSVDAAWLDDTASANSRLLYRGQVGTDTVVSDPLDVDLLLKTVRDPNWALDQQNFYLEHVNLAQDDAYVAGAGFDPVSGQARAPIYYHAHQYDSTAVQGNATTISNVTATTAWVFTYYLYFTYHGPASYTLLTSKTNTEAADPPYSMNHYLLSLRPFGEHEGDWQAISIMVCPTSSLESIAQTNTTNSTTGSTTFSSEPVILPPLSVNYPLPNGSRQVVDCTAGDCLLFGGNQHNNISNTVASSSLVDRWMDVYHPVGFVSLYNHYVYPVSATRVIYQELPTDYFVDLQGFFLIDQTNFRIGNDPSSTSTPSYHYFWPNATNLLELMDPRDVIANVTDPRDYWQAFAGAWGGENLYEWLHVNDSSSIVPPLPDHVKPPLPTCFNEVGTAEETCPFQMDVVFVLVMQMLHVVDAAVDAVVRSAERLYRNVVSAVSGTGMAPRGPAAQLSFGRWIASSKKDPGLLLGATTSPIEAALILARSSPAEYCDRFLNTSQIWNPDRLPPSSPSSSDVDVIRLEQNAKALVFFCSLLVCINVVVYLHPRWGGSKRPPLLIFDPVTGVVQPPSRRLALSLSQPALMYFASYLGTMAGLTLYFIGYADLITLIEVQFGLDLGSVKVLSYLFGIFVSVIDTAMLIFIYLPPRMLWLQMCATYHDLIGDEVQAQQFKRRVRCSGRCTILTFQIMYGVLFNSFILACLCVLIGCIDVGVAYFVGDTCRNLVGVADGVCLNLYQWGIQIGCGADFAKFCSAWASRSSVVTLWGSVCTVLGQYYLITSAGAASSIYRSIPYSLSLVPTRAMYQQDIQHRALLIAMTEGQGSEGEDGNKVGGAIEDEHQGNNKAVLEPNNSQDEITSGLEMDRMACDSKSALLDQQEEQIQQSRCMCCTE